MTDFKVGYLLQAARPRQWIKNLLLFAAIVFGQRLGDRDACVHAVIAFALFCLLSSGVYLINDILDAPKDRLHPVKSKRPIAAGKVNRSTALLWAVVFIIVSITGGFALGVAFGLSIVAYALLQFLYMLWLKREVILDVLSIAMGFVLRALAGGFAIEIVISHWLMVCTLFLALFLAVCKRRHELLLLGENSAQHRCALLNYSASLLDQMVAVATSSTIIAYALYTVAPETQARFGGHHLIYTVPFVLFGIFRYLFLVYRKEEGGSPEGVLLGDKALLVNIALFCLAVGLLVYWQ